MNNDKFVTCFATARYLKPVQCRIGQAFFYQRNEPKAISQETYIYQKVKSDPVEHF